MNSSWRSSAIGASMLVVTLITSVLIPWLRGDGVDVGSFLGDPQVTSNISVVLMGLLGAGLGFVTRDNKVTSEEALKDPQASAKAKAELKAAGIE